MTVKRERLTVSLPAGLVDFVRVRAAEMQVTRSAVVEGALRQLAREERNRRIMEERLADAAEDSA